MDSEIFILMMFIRIDLRLLGLMTPWLKIKPMVLSILWFQSGR